MKAIANEPPGALHPVEALLCAWLWCVLLQAPVAAQNLPAGSDSSTNRVIRHDHSFSYFNDLVSEKPWSVHVAKVQIGNPDFLFCTTLGKGQTLGMGTLSEQLKSLSPNAGQVLAAINGDFYEKAEGYEGRPRDLQICWGEVVSSPAGHTCFWISTNGQPQMTNVFSLFRVVWPDRQVTPIGLNEPREDDKAVLYTKVLGGSTHTSGGIELVLEPASTSAWEPLRASRTYSASVQEVRTSGDAPLRSGQFVLSLGPQLASRLPGARSGTVLQIITETVPDLTGVNVAIGGGPTLVRNRKAMEWKGFIHMRHPRTAIGWNDEFIFLVQVDGRQTGSIGMTFSELADYMLKLGCTQAMNFDGGGSATLWALGSVRNSPSEGQERPSPNALVVLKKKLPANTAAK